MAKQAPHGTPPPGNYPLHAPPPGHPNCSILVRGRSPQQRRKVRQKVARKVFLIAGNRRTTVTAFNPREHVNEATVPRFTEATPPPEVVDAVRSHADDELKS